MFKLGKLEKYLKKILAHFEFDASNKSQNY